MFKIIISLLLLLITNSALFSQELTLDIPESLSVKLGRITRLTVMSNGKNVSWDLLPGTEADVFREYDPVQVKLCIIVYSEKPIYLIVAVTSANGQVKQKTCVINPELKPIIPPSVIPVSPPNIPKLSLISSGEEIYTIKPGDMVNVVWENVPQGFTVNISGPGELETNHLNDRKRLWIYASTLSGVYTITLRDRFGTVLDRKTLTKY